MAYHEVKSFNIPKEEIPSSIILDTYQQIKEILEKNPNFKPQEIDFEINARGVRVASVLEPEKYLRTEEDKKFVEKFDLFGVKKAVTRIIMNSETLEIERAIIEEYY